MPTSSKKASDWYLPNLPCEVRSFFSDAVACVSTLYFIENLKSNQQALKAALLKGNVTPIERLFHGLLEAAAFIEVRMQDLV